MQALISPLLKCAPDCNWYDYWNKLYFVRHGIPGPFPLPIIGTITSVTKGMTSDFIEKKRKYGKVVGLSIGFNIFLIYDLDMLKEILISQFSYFPNHGKTMFEDKPLNEAINVVRDERWREVRNTLSPAFSGKKMKQMTGRIRECCDQLVEHFHKLKGQEGGIQCYDLYGAFSLDVVANTFFGMQIDSQRNPNDPFVKMAKEAFSISIYNPKVLLSILMPRIGKLYNLLGISVTKPEIKKFFLDVISRAIELRNEEANKRVDFLQLMIDAHKLDNQEDGEADAMVREDTATNKDAQTRTHSKAALTTNEVMANAFTFLLAGYETTNVALCFTSYLLAMNPEQQDRLIEEVDKYTPTKEDLSYEVLSQMEYLDCVVRETLRLYPPSAATDRFNDKQDVVIRGLTIPKGFSVLVPVYAIHHDPEVWDSPEEFRPERFSKENRHKIHPASWLPFGNGPRSCLGMRLALMEIKFAVVRILQEFRYEKCPETEIPPVLNTATAFISPPNGVILQVVPRKKTN
ncbi:putative cytochrome P450 3A24 [Apostichopus japonicus]|uniref:Thromboxane-A synthase n=1 Tax=Stichopus japonicus TaxID=307972 RepID=A0A2G8JW43_STIJA|nr:putative cytochrome P450 3A24 [Apostichopus japonicus]